MVLSVGCFCGARDMPALDDPPAEQKSVSADVGKVQHEQHAMMDKALVSLPRSLPSQDSMEAPLAFSFSGGGFLLPYFCGVAHQLQYMGLLQPGRTPLCGSSAGSLIAGCITAGISVPKMLSSFLSVAADCRKHGVPRRLSALLRAQLHQHLPHDAHARCSGLAHVGITKMWPKPHSKVISEFHSREDLVAALLASCYLPYLSDGSFTTTFRGKRVIDGGLTALMPYPPLSAGSLRVVRISCIPKAHMPHMPMINKKAQLRDVAFAPDEFGTWPHNVQETLGWALKPASHTWLLDLVGRGQRDTLAWALASGAVQRVGEHKVHLAPSLADSVPEWNLPTAEKAGAHVPLEPVNSMERQACQHAPTEPSTAATATKAAAVTSAVSPAEVTVQA